MYFQTMRHRTVAAAIAVVTSIPIQALIPNGALAGAPDTTSSVGAAEPAGERSKGHRLAANDGNKKSDAGGASCARTLKSDVNQRTRRTQNKNNNMAPAS